MEKWKLSEKQIWIIAGGMFVISRIILFVMYILLFHNTDIAGFLKEINHFDSNHYIRIAEMGYQSQPYNMSGEAGWAFFPLYPLLVGKLSVLTAVPIRAAAFILGGIFAILAIGYGCKYLMMIGAGTEAAMIYVLLMTQGMYSFYFSAFYTEAPFLFFLTASLYYLEKRKYLLMGVFGLLLSLTRNLGVFLVLVIVVKLIMDYREYDAFNGEENKTRINKYIASILLNPALIAGVSIIPLGMFSYMYYLYRKVGDGFAFVHVQIAWGRENSLFLKHFINGLKSLTGYDAFGAMFAVLGFYLIILMIFKYKRYHEALFAILVMVLPMSSCLDSIARYMFGAFVFAAAAAREIGDMKWYSKAFWLVFICGYELVLINGWYYGAGILT